MVAVVLLDHRQRPVLGVAVDLAGRYERVYIPLKPRDMSKIPTRTSTPRLTFIDDRTPIFYFGEQLDLFLPHIMGFTAAIDRLV